MQDLLSSWQIRISLVRWLVSPSPTEWPWEIFPCMIILVKSLKRQMCRGTLLENSHMESTVILVLCGAWRIKAALVAICTRRISECVRRDVDVDVAERCNYRITCSILDAKLVSWKSIMCGAAVRSIFWATAVLNHAITWRLPYSSRFTIFTVFFFGACPQEAWALNPKP